MNPFSGVAGQSLEIWSQLKTLFRVAHVGIEETMTTHKGHAEEVCSTIDLDTVKDGIVVVSGDGLFHEVVNGLLHREDWEAASRIPLGIVPAGSGNGLARSIQVWNPVQAALAIIKGKTNLLDTWSVIANKERRFSVLSIEWGTVAAIDFDSEKVRFLGSARFHLWSLLKLINRQRYSAEFSILRGQEDPSDHPRLQQLQAALQQEQLLRKIEGLNQRFEAEVAAKRASSATIPSSSSSSTSNGASSSHAPPLAETRSIFSEPARTPTGSMTDLPVLDGSVENSENGIASEFSPKKEGGPENLGIGAFAIGEQLALNRENLSSLNLDAHGQPIDGEAATLETEDLKVVATPEAVLAPLDDARHPMAGVDVSQLRGPPLKYLSNARAQQRSGEASEEGDKWETLSGDWMLILALNTTHMAHNVQAAPRASISDGLIDVLTISKVSRRTLLRMILAMENGTHMNDPDVSYTKAKAFVLRPLGDDEKHRLHGIDGEKCDCDGLAVEVHPRLLSIFCDPDALTEAALSNPHSFLSKELQKLNLELVEEMKREVAQLPLDEDSSPPKTIPPSTAALQKSPLQSPSKDSKLESPPSSFSAALAPQDDPIDDPSPVSEIVEHMIEHIEHLEHVDDKQVENGLNEKAE